MSLKLLHTSAAAELMRSIQDRITNATFVSNSNVVKGFGMESLDQPGLIAQNDAIGNAKRVIQDAIVAANPGTPNGGLEGYSDAQLESAAIASLIGTDAAGYANSLRNANARATTGGFETVTGSRYGSANPTQGYGMEAFEQAQGFTPQQSSTIEYNLKAAKQDPVGEAYFPTTTLTANDIGLDIKVPVDIVEPFIKHKSTGAVTDWQRKKLINAMRDPTILRNDATKLIPYKNPDNSTAANFSTIVPAFAATQNSESVPSGALLPGKRIGFIGLCSTPGLIQAGALEASDQIDTGAKLERIWVQVTNAGGTSELFSFDTHYMDRAFFQKSQEGDKFETSLDFKNIFFELTATSTTTDGVVSTLLAPLVASSQTAVLQVDLSGSLNHEKGALLVNSLTPPAIARIYDTVDHSEVNITSGALATSIAGLTFTFAGYSLRAYLRNSNFRTREQRIDRQTSTYKYLVQLGAPITAIAPASDAWGPAESIAVETLSNATYARNSAMAISRLLDFVDTIRSSGVTNNGLWQRYDENSVEGVGKAVIDPWFAEGAYDISKLVNNIRSAQSREDISEKILNILRTYAYRMNAESGYNVALGLLYNEVQPTLVVATDNIIAQYLMEVGDLRTAGVTFKIHVATTNNIEMKGKLIMTLSRMKAGGLDLLTFGMHLWVPEIVATVSVMRNGTFVKETMVQPRNLHVVVCPIIAYITLTGLDEAYQGKVVLDFYSTNIAGVNTDDLNGLVTHPADNLPVAGA